MILHKVISQHKERMREHTIRNSLGILQYCLGCKRPGDKVKEACEGVQALMKELALAYPNNQNEIDMAMLYIHNLLEDDEKINGDYEDHIRLIEEQLKKLYRILGGQRI